MRDLDGSQEPGILHDGQTAEPKTGSVEVFIIPRGFLEDSSGILTIPEDFQN